MCRHRIRKYTEECLSTLSLEYENKIIYEMWSDHWLKAEQKKNEKNTHTHTAFTVRGKKRNEPILIGRRENKWNCRQLGTDRLCRLIGFHQWFIQNLLLSVLGICSFWTEFKWKHRALVGYLSSVCGVTRIWKQKGFGSLGHSAFDFCTQFLFDFCQRIFHVYWWRSTCSYISMMINLSFHFWRITYLLKA